MPHRRFTAASITPHYRHPPPQSTPRTNPTLATQTTAARQAQPRRHNPRRAQIQPLPPQFTVSRQQPSPHNSQPRASSHLADTIQSRPPIFFPRQKNGSAAHPQPWQPDKIKPRSRLQKYAESDSFKLSPLSYRRNSRNPDYTNSIIAVSAPSPRRAPRR